MLILKNNLFEYEPYPYGYFNDILDIDFYRSLCNEFPEKNDLKIAEDKKKYNLNKFNKFSLTNDDKEFNSIIKKKPSFKKLYEYLDSEDFISKISDILIENNIDLQLQYYFKKFFVRKRKYNIFFEFSSIPCDGGFILPHTDAPKKVMTFIIPIIKDEEKDIENFEKIGTSILAMSDNKFSFNYFNKTIKYENTLEKKYVNFSRNNMLMFIKTYNSLHSVGPIQPLNPSIKFRNSITFSLRKNVD
tara:strand:+ start:956 stop:1690 length:735 start_codon:yes stop_codon:yes gene_type:complete